MRLLPLLAVCAALFAFDAQACAVLEEGEPRVGSTVSTPVDRVALTFSGAIYPQSSTLIVEDERGVQVSAGKAYGEEGGTRIATRVNGLVPGRYTVRWSVLCDCGTPIPGHYRFTVR